MESTCVMQGLMKTNALGVSSSDAIPELRQASEELTDLGQRFLAGYVLVQAIRAAWGDPDLMRTVAQEARLVLAHGEYEDRDAGPSASPSRDRCCGRSRS
jgi:hypothetical protein